MHNSQKKKIKVEYEKNLDEKESNTKTEIDPIFDKSVFLDNTDSRKINYVNFCKMINKINKDEIPEINIVRTNTMTETKIIKPPSEEKESLNSLTKFGYNPSEQCLTMSQTIAQFDNFTSASINQFQELLRYKLSETIAEDDFSNIFLPPTKKKSKDKNISHNYFKSDEKFDDIFFTPKNKKSPLKNNICTCKCNCGAGDDFLIFNKFKNNEKLGDEISKIIPSKFSDFKIINFSLTVGGTIAINSTQEEKRLESSNLEEILNRIFTDTKNKKETLQENKNNLITTSENHKEEIKLAKTNLQNKNKDENSDFFSDLNSELEDLFYGEDFLSEKKIKNKISIKKPPTQAIETKDDFLPDKIQKIREQWECLQQMRTNINAPVDEIRNFLNESKQKSFPVYKFQVLIYLILSQRTNDSAVYTSFNKLREKGFTCEQMSNLTENEISELINGISFSKNKTTYIKKLIKIIKEDYNYNPPETPQEVMDLPGIGPIMSEIYFNFISDDRKSVSISSHIHRVVNRLAWVTTDNYNDTKTQMENLLPRSWWDQFNYIFDGFGLTICTRTDPNCGSCLLKDTCDFKINNKYEKEKLEQKLARQAKIEHGKNKNEKVSNYGLDDEEENYENILENPIENKSENIKENPKENVNEIVKEKQDKKKVKSRKLTKKQNGEDILENEIKKKKTKSTFNCTDKNSNGTSEENILENIKNDKPKDNEKEERDDKLRKIKNIKSNISTGPSVLSMKLTSSVNNIHPSNISGQSNELNKISSNIQKGRKELNTFKADNNLLNKVKNDQQNNINNLENNSIINIPNDSKLVENPSAKNNLINNKLLISNNKRPDNNYKPAINITFTSTRRDDPPKETNKIDENLPFKNINNSIVDTTSNPSNKNKVSNNSIRKVTPDRKVRSKISFFLPKPSLVIDKSNLISNDQLNDLRYNIQHDASLKYFNLPQARKRKAGSKSIDDYFS